MDDAIHELLGISRKPTRAECIGFLQILVSQQDAVYHLGQCIGITWKPAENVQLKKIRDLRNRISAHSAWTDRGGKSSSMVNWQDIRQGGFKAIIYRAMEPEANMPLYEDIEFEEYVALNIDTLSKQIPNLLNTMEK